MRKNIYRLVVVGILLAYAIPLSLSASATEVVSIEMTDAEMAAVIEYGPGSDCPISSPIESEYVWISTVEPIKARWIIYDPGMHYVTTIEHIPSIKQKLTTGEHAGKWAYGDRSAFTLPAFAAKGTWLAKCDYIMADGSISSPPISAEGTAIYLAIPCTLPGDWFGNVFLYPWYLMGMKMPALFWFPLALFWLPALFILILIVWTRSVGGFGMVIRGAIDAGKKAIRQARRG